MLHGSHDTPPSTHGGPPAQGDLPAGTRSVSDGDSPESWVTSPCTGLCILDASNLCTGCGRTVDEIVHWTCMSSDQRRAVLAAVEARSAR